MNDDWIAQVCTPLQRRIHKLGAKREEYRGRIETAAHPDERRNLGLILETLEEDLAVAMLQLRLAENESEG